MIATAESVQLLTPQQVATLLAITTGTLANWRCNRKGPPFVRMGSTIRYRADVISEWVEGQTVETRNRA